MSVRRVLFLAGWLLVAAIGLVIGSSRGIVASDGADDGAKSSPHKNSGLGSHLLGGAYVPDPDIEKKLRALKAPIRPKTNVRKPAARPKLERGRAIRIDEPRTANMEHTLQPAPMPNAATAAKPATKSAESDWRPTPSTDTEDFDNERFEEPITSQEKIAGGEGWHRNATVPRNTIVEEKPGIEAGAEAKPSADATMNGTPKEVVKEKSGVKASAENESAADAETTEAPAEARAKDDATKDAAVEKAAIKEIPFEHAGSEDSLANEPIAEDAPSKDVATGAAPVADSKHEEAPAEKAAIEDVHVDDNKQATEAPIEEARAHDPAADRPRTEPAGKEKADVENTDKDRMASDVPIEEKRVEPSHADTTSAEETRTESLPTKNDAHEIDSVPATISVPLASPAKPAIQQTANQVPQSGPQTPQVQPPTSRVPVMPSPVGQPIHLMARPPQASTQPAEIAARPPQAIAQPSQAPQPPSEVLQQLQKLYEENGREMPPMQLHDAPQTQSLPGNGLTTRDLQKRPGAPSDAPRKKPNMLQRIFRLRGSKQAPAADVPPADHPRTVQTPSPASSTAPLNDARHRLATEHRNAVAASNGPIAKQVVSTHRPEAEAPQQTTRSQSAQSAASQHAAPMTESAAEPQRVMISAMPANPPAPEPATVAPELAATPKFAAVPAVPTYQSAPEQPAETPAPVAEPHRIEMSAVPALDQPSVPQPSPMPGARAAEAAAVPAAAIASAPTSKVTVQSAPIGSDVAIEEAGADDEPAANDDFNPFTGLKLTEAESTQAAQTTETKTAEAPVITPTAAAPSHGLVFPETSLSNEPGRVRTHSTGEIERVHTEFVANSEPGRVHAQSAADTFAPANDAVDVKSGHADQIRRIIERSGKPGLKGFCLVALRDDRELVDVQPEFVLSYEGKEYYFSSSKSKAKFAENPTKYLPAAGGADVVVLTHTNQAVPGTLEYSLWFREKFFMFSSNETRQTFIRNPRQYVAAAASSASAE